MGMRHAAGQRPHDSPAARSTQRGPFLAVVRDGNCGSPAVILRAGSVERGIAGEQAHGEAPEAPQLATRAGVDERHPV